MTVWEVLKEALTPILVIVGWITVHRLSQARDDRKLLLDLKKDSHKEIREHTRELLKNLRGFETRATKLHTDTTLNEPDVDILLTELERFSRDVLFIMDESKHADLISNLKRSISLHNLDSAEFEKQPLDSPILKQIRFAVLAIEDDLLPQSRLWAPPNSVSEM